MTMFGRESDRQRDELGGGPLPRETDSYAAYRESVWRLFRTDGQGYLHSFCANRNAWASIEAFWVEPDTMHPSKPWLRAPGLVVMFAGMNVVKGKVAYGRYEQSLVETGQTEATHGASTAVEEIIKMTAHIMILPLPGDLRAAGLPGASDPE